MISDRLVVEFDRALRTVFAKARAVRPIPGGELPEADLSPVEKRHAAALMRINHCGEVCAQALYQGQALTAKSPENREALRQAGEEETEHLAWTERRIAELGGRTSYLNPLWYAGSFAMGVAAGRLGERWNLGFLAETERQVEAHLHGHLEKLPPQDLKSRMIVAEMKADEVRHAETAVRLGAAPLPWPVKLAMKMTARIMTRTAYYL